VIPTASGLEFSMSLSGGIAPLFADDFETGNTSAWSTPQTEGLLITPPSVVFSEVALGTESGSRVVTVRNDGENATYLSALWIEGTESYEFAIDHDSCSWSWLEPGQSCTLGVTMLTIDAGSFSAVLVIPAEVAGKRQTGPVRLTGRVRWP